MAKFELLIFVISFTLVCSTEIENAEQKKRDVAKGTNLNSVPTGAQKQDYTYNAYSSNPSSQNSQSYQSQVPNSFYPNHGSSQYYSSSNTQTETPYTVQQSPQINLLPPTSHSQFVPLNFVPNPGYHVRYNSIPSKPNGNIHLAIYQQPSNYPSSIMSYNPQSFSPHALNQINSHQVSHPGFNLSPQVGHFNIPSNYQQLPLAGSSLGQPLTMLLFAQPSLTAPYNNILHPNPLQNFYNYYPTNTQNKLNVQYASQGVTNEYEKVQNSIPQSITKEDIDINHSSEYTSPSDSSYKSAYSMNRNSYAKL